MNQPKRSGVDHAAASQRVDQAGITRRRRGEGFAYYGPGGDLLCDEHTLQRIKDLVIPPAWRKVWVCPYANGHIQAVGTDVAGRRQYMYHQAWQQDRAEEKFDRVLELSKQLPVWRSQVAHDLAGRGLTRERVLALAPHLLDRGYFRAGGEQYAKGNESYGVATLLCEHVTVRRGTVNFDYPAKAECAAHWWSRIPKWFARYVRCWAAPSAPNGCWCAEPHPVGPTFGPRISGRRVSRRLAAGAAMCSVISPSVDPWRDWTLAPRLP